MQENKRLIQKLRLLLYYFSIEPKLKGVPLSYDINCNIKLTGYLPPLLPHPMAAEVAVCVRCGRGKKARGKERPPAPREVLRMRIRSAAEGEERKRWTIFIKCTFITCSLYMVDLVFTSS